MLNKYLVEFLGVMLLVFVNFYTGNFLATGATLAFMLYFVGPISGGAFNPALTIVHYRSGKIMKEEVIQYIIVEILGALAGFEVYKHFLHNVKLNKIIL